MKAKLPPLVLDHPRPNRPASPVSHRATHPVKHKAVDKGQAKDNAPRSTEETKSDGNAFREALFGPTAAEQEAALGMSGGFGDGGGQSKGQGGGRQQNQRGDMRSQGAGARAGQAEQAARSAEMTEPAGSAADGWMELELDSMVAGKIRLSVLKEQGLLRARLVMGNPLAAQWMREHLASVEQQLAEELGCQVRLEMK